MNFYGTRRLSLRPDACQSEKERQQNPNDRKKQLSAIFDKVNELEPMKDIAYKNIMLELMEHGVEQVNFRSASIEEQKIPRSIF